MADMTPAEKEKSAAKAKKPWIAVGICAVLAILTFVIIHARTMWGSSNTLVVESDPDTKLITLNDVVWQGFDNVDQTKEVRTHMLTRDVWTLSRVDGNDHLIVTNYPADWKRNTTNQLPNGNYLEMMVMPGQRGSDGKPRTAECLFKRVPRT